MLKTKWFFYIFALAAALIVTALFMQYQMDLEPCPLCLMQRIAFILIGLLALIAIFVNFNGFRRLCGGLISLVALAGCGLAGRQLWLQSLPEDQVPTCGPGFDYMINNFPFSKALSMILTGSGECAEIHWVFLGLTIPGWSILFFIGFSIVGLLMLFSAKPIIYE